MVVGITRTIKRRTGSACIGMALSFASLQACQTNSMSIDEALKTSANFGSAGFVAPQRSIDDVRKMLGPIRPLPNDCVARRQKMNEDLAFALEGTKAGIRSLFFLDPNRTPADTEFARGNFANAERLVRTLGESLPELHRSRGELYVKLSRMYAAVGNPGAARSALRTAIYVWIHNKYLLGNETAENAMEASAEAAIAQAEGDLSEAESLLRVAIRDLPLIDPTLHIDLGKNLLHQGKLVEAELEMRKGLLPLVLWQHDSYRSSTGIAVTLFARILAAQNRLDDARSIARSAVNMFEFDCAPLDSFTYADARQVLAGIMGAQGDWSEAMQQFSAIERDLAGSPETLDRTTGANPDWPIALAKMGRIKEARQRLRRARSIVAIRHGKDSREAAILEAIGALVESEAGANEKALAGFNGALAKLDARRAESVWDERRGLATGRWRLILTAYLDLLSRLETLGGASRDKYIEEMFRVADRLRGASVQSALNAAGARAAAGNSGLAELIRGAQDATRQLASSMGILRGLEAAAADQRSQAIVEKMRNRVSTLRQARRKLTAQIESEFPEYAALINPKPPSVDEIRAVLGPEEVLLSTFVGKKRSYVWAIPGEGAVAFSTVSLGRADLAAWIGELRSSLDVGAVETLGDIPAFDTIAAFDLYRRLLMPVEAGWKAARHMLVVPDGPLGYLPFSALPTAPPSPVKDDKLVFAGYRKVNWLARSHAVSVLPSAAALLALRKPAVQTAKRRPFVGFGDPYFNLQQAANAAKGAPRVATLDRRGGKLTIRAVRKSLAGELDDKNVLSSQLEQLMRLPGTSEELKLIARALGADTAKVVFTGPQASETRVKSMDLSRFKVVAFATHGLVPGDLNGLGQPALALSSPKVTRRPDEDGLLTMGEVLGLRLHADWVVLSACNTGSAEGAGAEAFSGLGRAFFYAGARAMLLSNWPVETRSAKALTTGLFRRQAENPTLSRAEALRRTMVGLIDGVGGVDPKTGKAVFSYAHPLFWAPFSLIGDGGGGRPTS